MIITMPFASCHSLLRSIYANVPILLMFTLVGHCLLGRVCIIAGCMFSTGLTFVKNPLSTCDSIPRTTYSLAPREWNQRWVFIALVALAAHLLNLLTCMDAAHAV